MPDWVLSPTFLFDGVRHYLHLHLFWAWLFVIIIFITFFGYSNPSKWCCSSYTHGSPKQSSRRSLGWSVLFLRTNCYLWANPDEFLLKLLDCIWKFLWLLLSYFWRLQSCWLLSVFRNCFDGLILDLVISFWFDKLNCFWILNPLFSIKGWNSFLKCHYRLGSELETFEDALIDCRVITLTAVWHGTVNLLFCFVFDFSHIGFGLCLIDLLFALLLDRDLHIQLKHLCIRVINIGVTSFSHWRRNKSGGELVDSCVHLEFLEQLFIVFFVVAVVISKLNGRIRLHITCMEFISFFIRLQHFIDWLLGNPD